MKLKIREALPSDLSLFLEFTKGLAAFEKMSELVVATEESLYHWIFERKTAHLLLGEVDGEVVMTAIYFYNFSTFEGASGIYLEDLYVLPRHRGKGYGTAMLRHLAKLAVKEGCARFEWVSLDWNERAITIYKNLGAVPHPEWLLFRLDGKALKQFAQGEK